MLLVERRTPTIHPLLLIRAGTMTLDVFGSTSSVTLPRDHNAGMSMSSPDSLRRVMDPRTSPASLMSHALLDSAPSGNGSASMRPSFQMKARTEPPSGVPDS